MEFIKWSNLQNKGLKLPFTGPKIVGWDGKGS